MRNHPLLPVGMGPSGVIIATLLVVATPLGATTRRQVVEALMTQLHQPDPPGETLFEEDFEDGSLEGWWHDAGWRIIDRPEGRGKCGQGVSSPEDHEDLALNVPLPVVPDHPIVVCWKTRFGSGSTPLWLRVDFFDQNGQQCVPYARQEQSQGGRDWTENSILVSAWFPPAPRAISLWFHHGPNDQTTSWLDDVRVVDLGPAVHEIRAQELVDWAAQMTALLAELPTLPPAPVNDSWKTAIRAHSESGSNAGARPGRPGKEWARTAVARSSCRNCS